MYDAKSNSEMSVIGTLLSDYKSVPVEANITTEGGSVTLTKGTWFLFSYMDLASSISATYNNVLNGRIVRNSGAGGGGSINNYIYRATEDNIKLTASTYVTQATTVRAFIYALRIK